MRPITALLIVKNEAVFIERALNSLLWCDEIVVVDAFSTDATLKLCTEPGAPWASRLRFIQKEWLGFSKQRNFALEQAKHEWAFFLDGDESCSPALKDRIQELLRQNSLEPAQYKIHRQEFFLKKPIRHGIWNPSYHLRFFPKSQVQFIGDVHEGIESKLPVKTIHESIIHVEDLRIERFLGKLNHYTTIQAQNDFDRGRKTSFWRILVSFPAMFYKNYIYYGSYKDGKEGFIISVLEGLSRTVRHLKIWQLHQISRRNTP